ncbi:MAG: hypothetical protein AABY16_01295 [Nanoarchaeota archaeon]
MALNDILGLGMNEAAGRGIRDKFIKEQGVNAMAEIAVREGRGDDPAVEHFVDMAPARQRKYLEETVAQYRGELGEAVLGDLPVALSGFKKPRDIFSYLLGREPTEVRHELADRHKKAYAAARFLSNKEAVNERVNEYIDETVGKIGEDVKDKKISKGLGSALVFVYQQNRGIALTQVTGPAHKDLGEFEKAVQIDNGRDYMTARIGAMDEKKDKVQEAYAIGRAVTELADSKE